MLNQDIYHSRLYIKGFHFLEHRKMTAFSFHPNFLFHVSVKTQNDRQNGIPFLLRSRDVRYKYDKYSQYRSRPVPFFSRFF